MAKASVFGMVKISEEWSNRYSKEELMAAYESSAEGADIIISSALAMIGAFSICEKLDIPCVPVHLTPLLPTSEFPVCIMESIAICNCMSKWTYNISFKTVAKARYKYINPWRVEKLGLPPLTSPRGVLDIILDIVCPPIIIAGAKKALFKSGEIPTDYPSHACCTGFFFVPSALESSIDPVLVQFINNNPQQQKTLYLGFGSMPANNPKALVKLVIDTCTEMECRAIIVAGWSRLDDEECQKLLVPAVNNGTILIIKGAPHDWLFPRCDCIVHHCGIGTMAAALRSGRPQIPCPVIFDQPYNSRTLLGLGCA